MYFPNPVQRLSPPYKKQKISKMKFGNMNSDAWIFRNEANRWFLVLFYANHIPSMDRADPKVSLEPLIPSCTTKMGFSSENWRPCPHLLSPQCLQTPPFVVQILKASPAASNLSRAHNPTWAEASFHSFLESFLPCLLFWKFQFLVSSLFFSGCTSQRNRVQIKQN